MTDTQAVSPIIIRTVIDYGADPECKSDSSAAFQAMADDPSISAVIVPEGRFKIDKTVDLKLKNLLGPGKGRYGQPTRDISHITTGALKGDNDYLFIHQGAEFDGLTFRNLGNGGVLECEGYNGKVSNCYFESLGVAIHQKEIFVNFHLEFCNFTSVGYGIRQDKKGALNTTLHLTGCEFNNTGHGVVLAGQMFGCNFRDNIFEQMTGDAVKASHIYECNFTGNWWEGHNDHDRNQYPDGYPCVSVSESQQMMNNFAGANHVSENWQNIFHLSEEGRNGNGMGGVSTNDGIVRVISSVGKAVHVTPDGIRASRADWVGNEPFVIEAGCSRAPWWPQDIALRTGGGDVVLDNYPTNDDGGAFNGALKFLKSVDVTGEGDNRKVENPRYESLHLVHDGNHNPQPGLIGTSQLDPAHTALIGVPVQAYVCEGEQARGLGAFEEVDRSKQGEVSLRGSYGMDNPMINVTVEDRGVVFDGVTYDKGGYGNDASRWSWWLTLHFIERQTGQPVTPKGFWLWFNLHTGT